MLVKLNVKTVQRTAYKYPVKRRRTKLLSAIEQQMRVHEAAHSGCEYTVRVKRQQKGEGGEHLRVEADKRVRRWFFAQNGGVYVECKYGALTLPNADKGNAVFAKE